MRCWAIPAPIKKLLYNPTRTICTCFHNNFMTTLVTAATQNEKEHKKATIVAGTVTATTTVATTLSVKM